MLTKTVAKRNIIAPKENYGCSMTSAIPFTLVNACLQSAPRNITHPRPSSVQNSSFNI